MKWSKFVSTNDEFAPGEWNVICDRSGLKLKSSQVARQWDGQMVRADMVEERNPQDFLRGKREASIPWARTEPDDTFGQTDASDL